MGIAVIWRAVQPGDAMRTHFAAAILAAGVLAPACARAADEEIQVYMDEIGPVGRLGLDVHLNWTPDGRAANADYAGQAASEGRWRVTPEFGYALSPNVELGAYLPLFTLSQGGHAEIGGVKGRIKFIAPHDPETGPFWGLNFELGRVRKDLDINPWNAELKGIAGVRSGPWTLAGNLNVDFPVSGPAKGPTTFEIATKASYAVSRTFSVGIENYNEVGDSHGLGHLGRRGQMTYLVGDASFGAWDLNFGVGRGYGDPEDRWVIKAIVGVPIS
jgi:hypothetical protein